MEIHLKAEAIFRKTDNGNPHWWTEDFVGNIRQFEEWQITVSKKSTLSRLLDFYGLII